MNDEKLLQLIAASDPVPNAATLHPESGDETPLLLAIYQRSGIMGEIHETTMKTEDRPPTQVARGVRWADDVAFKKQGRRWVAAAATAAVVGVISLTVLGVLTNTDDVAAPVIPDFSQDVTLVGEALTAAYNSGDIDLYLSLFAADAELEFSHTLGIIGNTISVAEYRGLIAGWSQTLNAHWEWVDCQRTGNAVTDPTLCQVRITNDWLELVGQEPNRARVTIGVVDGMITLWDHRGLRSPGDEAVARFEDWTRRLHPVEAALMWDGEASVTPIFSEESARLHLQLGEEFITQGSS